MTWEIEPTRDAFPAAQTPIATSNVSAYRTLGEIPAAASSIFVAAERENIEYSFDWFENLHQTVFANDQGVRYYVSQFNGSPSAVLPVRFIHRGLIRQIESLSNYYTSLYSPIFAPERTTSDLGPLIEKAARDCGRAHVMRFSPMDPHSPGYEALLTALRTAGWAPFQFFCFGNWYLKVADKWAEYLRKREGNLRSTIRRMDKKFAGDGGTLEIVTNPSMLMPAIQAFNDVYALSWKEPEPYPEFIPGLIRWLAASGRLRLGIARIAGRPVAAQLWMVSHGRASIYKLAHDSSFAAYSPGTVLTAHLMEHVIDHDQVSEVDYLIGDDKYKELWMSHRRERWGIVAYNPRTLLGFGLLVREVIGRTIRKAAARYSGRPSEDSLPHAFVHPAREAPENCRPPPELCRKITP